MRLYTINRGSRSLIRVGGEWRGASKRIRCAPAARRRLTGPTPRISAERMNLEEAERRLPA